MKWRFLLDCVEVCRKQPSELEASLKEVVRSLLLVRKAALQCVPRRFSAGRLHAPSSGAVAASTSEALRQRRRRNYPLRRTGIVPFTIIAASAVAYVARAMIVPDPEELMGFFGGSG